MSHRKSMEASLLGAEWSKEQANGELERAREGSKWGTRGRNRHQVKMRFWQTVSVGTTCFVENKRQRKHNNTAKSHEMGP